MNTSEIFKIVQYPFRNNLNLEVHSWNEHEAHKSQLITCVFFEAPFAVIATCPKKSKQKETN